MRQRYTVLCAGSNTMRVYAYSEQDALSEAKLQFPDSLPISAYPDPARCPICGGLTCTSDHTR